jgi:putative transposase
LKISSNVQVAKRFRVSQMSVSGWRRAFDAGGVQALASKAPPGGKLTDGQIEGLGMALDAGPTAHGCGVRTSAGRWPGSRR